MVLSSPTMLLFRVAGLCAVVAIGILSLVPGQARPHVLWTGSLEHVAAYFIAASLLCLGFLDAGPTARDPASASARHIALLLTGYGGILEALQLLVPGRGPAMLDWGADALGAGLGAGLVWLLRRPALAALR